VRATIASCPGTEEALWPPADVEVHVTVAPDLDTPFVVIRGGDRTVDLGDIVCVLAYVGSPLGEPEFDDAWVGWSQTVPDVLEPGGSSSSPAQGYPYDVQTCVRAIGVGVTELVATSDTWPDASASVTIEVIEVIE
jgi:hypothetical protein